MGKDGLLLPRKGGAFVARAARPKRRQGNSSVDFKIPRAQALAVAKQFAVAQGAQLPGYDSSIVFDLDDTAKTYLEREVGLQQANQMMAADVHIWYWQTR